MGALADKVLPLLKAPQILPGPVELRAQISCVLGCPVILWLKNEAVALCP